MSDIPKELHASTWTEREQKIYEIGYQEGGSSTSVDWIFALSEHLDIEADSPMGAVEKIKAALEEAHNDGIKDAQYHQLRE